MALAVSHHAALDDNNVYGNPRTTSSFTPQANSTLVVVASAYEYGNTNVRFLWGITGSANGLSFTKRAEVGEDIVSWVCWTAEVGPSPVAMTVSVDPNTTDSNATFGAAIQVASVKDTVAGPLDFVQVVADYTPKPVTGSSSDTRSLSVSFASPVTLGNVVIGSAQSITGGGTGAPTTPSGFTLLNGQSAAFNPSSAWWRSNMSGTGPITVTDLGQQVAAGAIIALELAAPVSAAPQSVAIAPATETSSARPLAVTAVRSRSISPASEFSAAVALGLTAVRFRSIGTAAEVDAAVPLARSTTRNLAIGAALEADTALALGSGQAGPPQAVAIGAAAEVDAAGALGLSTTRTLAIGAAAEVDAALAFTASQTYPGIAQGIGTAEETSTARSLGVATTVVVAISPALEVDTAVRFATEATGPFAFATDTLLARRDFITRRTGRHDATRLGGAWAEAILSGRRWSPTFRNARHDTTVRGEMWLRTGRPIRWFITVFDLEGDDAMPLETVAVGTVTQGEIPEALLIRVLRPTRDAGPNGGDDLALPLYDQTPAWVATAYILQPDGTTITRPVDILDPATLAATYPEDFAAPEEGWLRIDFEDGDFDQVTDSGNEVQIQVTLDNGVLRLKTRDVWEYGVADGPAAAVGA